jgi:hypothetical protein
MRHSTLHPSLSTRGNYWWLGCLLALMITDKSCASEIWATTGEPSGEKTASSREVLELQDGALTVHVVAAPLQQVMSQIGRLSGAKIVWLGQRDNRPVSVDFMALPVAEALPRLLGPNNFLLIYASTAERARLMEIWVAPQRFATRQTVLTTSDSASTEDVSDPSAVDAELEKMLESHLDMALHGTERDSRIEAIGFLGGLVEHDPRIRPLLEQLSTAEGDSQVRAAAAEVLSGMQE